MLFGFFVVADTGQHNLRREIKDPKFPALTEERASIRERMIAQGMSLADIEAILA